MGFYRESVQDLKWRNDDEFVIRAYKICGSGPTPYTENELLQLKLKLSIIRWNSRCAIFGLNTNVIVLVKILKNEISLSLKSFIYCNSKKSQSYFGLSF